MCSGAESSIPRDYKPPSIAGRSGVHAASFRLGLGAREAGFSLLETLVALVILSLALGVLYQGTSGATRNAMVSSQYSVATALAESVLDDFSTSVISGGTAQGVFEEFTWRAVAVPEVLPDGQPDVAQGLASGLNRIVVSVTWEGIGQTREVRLETLVDVPNEPPA